MDDNVSYQDDVAQKIQAMMSKSLEKNVKSSCQNKFHTGIILFWLCGLVQSEPSHDKFLRRLSANVRVSFI